VSVPKALCMSTAGGGNLDMIAGGGPKIWKEEDVPAEPRRDCFVWKGAIRRGMHYM